jgi:hypothetical protein
MGAFDWLRGRKPAKGDTFGRPTNAAATAAQRATDNGHCPAGIRHRGRCRHSHT